MTATSPERLRRRYGRHAEHRRGEEIVHPGEIATVVQMILEDYTYAYGAAYGTSRVGEPGQIARGSVSDQTGETAIERRRADLRKACRRAEATLRSSLQRLEGASNDLKLALARMDPPPSGELRSVDKYRLSKVEYEASREAQRRRAARGEVAV